MQEVKSYVVYKTTPQKTYLKRIEKNFLTDDLEYSFTHDFYDAKFMSLFEASKWIKKLREIDPQNYNIQVTNRRIFE